MNIKKIIPYILGIVLISIIAYYIGLNSILLSFKNANYWYLFIIIALEILEYFLLVTRIDYIFTNIKNNLFIPLLKVYAIGQGLSFVIPFRAGGELVRIYSFKKLLKLSFNDCFAVISVERIFDILMLSITILTSSFILAKIIHSVIYLGLFFAITIIFFIVFVFSKSLQKILKKMFLYFKLNKVMENVFAYLNNIKIILKNLRTFLFIFIFSIIIWSIDFLRVWVIFKMFGITVSFVLISGIIALSYLVSIAFILPGGLGVFEGGAVAIFTFFGIEKNIAFSAIFVERIFSYWIWIIIGLVLLSKKIVKSDKI